MNKMSKKLYMGVDPGRTGAVGIITEDMEFVGVIDCPVHKITKQIDVVKFAEALKPYIGKITKCVLEKAQVMPHDAKSRAFSYGQTVGIFKAILNLCSFNYVEVYPKTWKKYFNLGPDKNLSRTKCSKCIKGSAKLIARKKDHNRAEALLLAWYALLIDERKVAKWS